MNYKKNSDFILVLMKLISNNKKAIQKLKKTTYTNSLEITIL